MRRRSGGHPTHFGIHFNMRIGAETGSYAFRVGAKKGGFEVQQEECIIGDKSYKVRSGKVLSGLNSPMPPASSDRLYLVNAAGLPQFRPVYDALSSMGFYNLNPDQIRELQAPGSGNAASA